MSSNYLLPIQNYTICNALTWANCIEHFHRSSEGSWDQRVVHFVIGCCELLPIIAIFEMAIALLCFQEDSDLTSRKIKQLKFEELPLSKVQVKREVFPHEQRALIPHHDSSDRIEIVLPEKIEDLNQAFFPMHRLIENQYRDLPWPSKMQNIVVWTEVRGGAGDISAAAKAIAVMQRICPTLHFDWVLFGGKRYTYSSFLNCDDPSKVRIRNHDALPPSREPADFILVGPVKNRYEISYIGKTIQRTISGPMFAFLENAEELGGLGPKIILEANVKRALQETDSRSAYATMHKALFRNKSSTDSGVLPMGLQKGSGIFIDQGRTEAPLSRGYCCPSYLPKIQNEKLRKDVLEAMNVFDDRSEPDYDQFSLNFGYAHHSASWGKFIDCVAIHEKNKHVVIVLNQLGEFNEPTEQEFCDQILNPERLAFLQKKGYGTVIFGGENICINLQEAEGQNFRRLVVIVRPHFAPNDMKLLQLAAERLLATGDNSAVEAWCARCKLYLYEDVANLGCKWRFLQQQVDLANTISPNLGKLLALFGGDQRVSDRATNKPLNEEQMEEMETVLNDPNLSDATLQFCDQIVANYAFPTVLEGALKRTAWHHCMPELQTVEAEILDKEFQIGLMTYLKNPESANRHLTVRSLPALGRQIKEALR